MKTRLFGTTGRAVSVVGQGTWPLPDVAALRYGISLGLTHIDTAEMYGDGRSEALVGEAIRGCARDELFLVSKVLPAHGRAAELERSCEASLKRMGITEFDCYLLHWRSEVDLTETIAGLERLLIAGKTRAIGVSNLDPWDLREAHAALSTASFACNQVLYNLAERTVEAHELPWAVAHQQALVAYTPLGGIPMSGPATDVLREIAATHRAAVEAVALAFLLRHDAVFVIPKASQHEHVAINAAAGRLELSAEEIASIDEHFPMPIRTGPLPMN